MRVTVGQYVGVHGSVAVQLQPLDAHCKRQSAYVLHRCLGHPGSDADDSYWAISVNILQ